MYLVEEQTREIKIKKPEGGLSKQQMAYFVEKNLKQLVETNLLDLSREVRGHSSQTVPVGQDILTAEERRQYQYVTKYG